MRSIFSLKNVSFRYTEEWVLHNISMEVRDGEILGIIGPNGSGKSSLLKILSGINIPQIGQRALLEKDMSSMGESEMARIVAVVPQESFFSFPYTVIEVVMMGRTPHLNRRLFEDDYDAGVVRETMEWTDILGLAEKPVTNISGGERQRAIIARALAQEPVVLILDEPSASLDIAHQMDVFNILTRLNIQKGMTVIFSSHDLNLASQYCHRILLMSEGRIYAEGTTDQVITEENIQSVYGCPVIVDIHPVTKTPRVTLFPGERRMYVEQ